mgnify:CR=1 FL=1
MPGKRIRFILRGGVFLSRGPENVASRTKAKESEKRTGRNAAKEKEEGPGWEKVQRKAEEGAKHIRVSLSLSLPRVCS